MIVSSGNFGANYEVEVQRVIDDLHLTRRPVANWILRGLQSELDKVSTELVSNLPETEDIIQKEINNEFVDIERQAKSYFLFSVKRWGIEHYLSNLCMLFIAHLRCLEFSRSRRFFRYYIEIGKVKYASMQRISTNELASLCQFKKQLKTHLMS